MRKNEKKRVNFDFSVFGQHADYIRLIINFVDDFSVYMSTDGCKSPLSDSDIEKIDKILNSLRYKEKEVLFYRLSLFGCEFKTYPELEEHFELSMELLRKIKKNSDQTLKRELTKLFRFYDIKKALDRVQALEEELFSVRKNTNEMVDGISNFLDKARHSNPDFQESTFGLDLPERISNCFKENNIKTIDQLTARTELELLEMKNFGCKSLWQIKDILAEKGLSLAIGHKF